MKINKEIDHKKLWFDSMIGMTWGFIATLIVGTIIGLFGLYSTKNIFTEIKTILSFITAFGIGIGIGVKLKMKPLQILAIGIAAFIIGQSLLVPKYINHSFNWSASIGIRTTKIFLPGDVFAAWLGSVMMAYVFIIFKWQTFIDILLVPIVGVLIGAFGSLWLTYLTSSVLMFIEWIIDHSINKHHWIAILLAPIVGVLMGFALSFPTSSAAIAFALHLTGDAATAAMAATAAQMISFGVMTYMATNSWSKALAVGFGTSMLQINNFTKYRRLLIIPMFVSGLVALLAVAIVPLSFSTPGVTSGMGTAGLYGPIFTLKVNGWTNLNAWMHVIFMQLVVPIIISAGLMFIFLKKNWIKKEMLEIQHA